MSEARGSAAATALRDGSGGRLFASVAAASWAQVWVYAALGDALVLAASFLLVLLEREFLRFPAVGLGGTVAQTT